MKIGIITYHSSHNYGSMLQAYALSSYLRSKGCDVEIIDYRNKRQLRLYKHPLSPFAYNYRYFLKYILSFTNPIWLYHECKKWALYERFIKEFLPVSSKQYRTWEEIKEDLPSLNYDFIIAGGDQIWNMKGLHFDTSYYLPSKLPYVKKISYSVSFGGEFLNKIESKDVIFIKNCLIDYSDISVREESVKIYLENVINKKVYITLDPTMLLKAEDFRIFIEKPIIKGNYIYYYSPFPRPEAERLAILYGDYLGLKVVTSAPHIMNKKNSRMCVLHESGPKEFLNLLSNATMVIGRSFHLVAFSLLFHKEFLVVDGDNDYRLKYILSKVGLCDRGVVNCSNYKINILKKIDYNRIDSIISELRENSVNYLKESIGI